MVASTGVVVLPGVRGAQQSALASAFAANGWTVRGTARAKGSADGWVTHVADPLTGQGLGEVFEGADVLAWTVPQDHRPGVQSRLAEALAGAVQAAGVARAVVNLATMLPDDAQGELFDELRAVVAAFTQTKARVTVLATPVYMDNLLAPFLASSIVQEGRFAYPLPADQPVAWLSHRSLGEFAVAAVRADRTGLVRVAGRENLTGPQVAAILTERLGRRIRFERLPLEALVAGLDAAYGPPAGERVASTYAYAQRNRWALAAPEPPPFPHVEVETFADFAQRQDWTRQAVA